MRYYKNADGGYITAIGTGSGGDEITESEYNGIMAVIQAKPSRGETVDYRLREDLTWEAFAVEPVDPTEEILDAQDALDAIFGDGGGEGE